MPKVDFTDRCTFSPDGHWRGCCAKHDKAYEEQDCPRWEADLNLALCIFGIGFGDLGRAFKRAFEALVCAGVGIRTILYAPCVYAFVRLCGWYFWSKAKRVCGPLRARKERKIREEAARAPGP